MKTQTIAFVVTSINSTSSGLVTIGKESGARGHLAIMVGDRKGPKSCLVPGIEFFSLQDQLESGFRIATEGPVDSYTRKMTGYLIAMSRGVDFIRETDDDNRPYESFFDAIPDSVFLRTFVVQDKWVNICSAFTDRHVWARGFPLNRVHDVKTRTFQWESEPVSRPSTHLVMQALADGDPDVDAIYRLTAEDTTEILFRQDNPVQIPSSSWTPFNSQATTWPKRLFPLMYLPATCSFRMTDIWRAFVTQRLLRELDSNLAYTAANVYQDRNAHDLMRDFADEVEGYVGYERLIDVLDALQLKTGESEISDNLRIAYRALTVNKFVTEDELPLLDAWLYDIQELGRVQ